MKFSIVIPTCDRPGPLRECLRRVLEQSAGHEVIVTNDGRSQIKTTEAAEGKVEAGGRASLITRMARIQNLNIRVIRVIRG